MRLAEVTAKQILAGYGIALPAGRECRSVEEVRAAAAELGPRVFVKAQVPVGDREASGLVQLADDADAAAAIAAEMLGTGEGETRVESVLTESAVDPDLSLYVSIHVDDEQRARVLYVGKGGGQGYDRESADVRAALPIGGLELYRARTLIGALGLVGKQREALSRAVVALDRAARDWHAYTIEVNPLFVTGDGAVAVDAKIELDDYSLRDVPNPDALPSRVESAREVDARGYQQSDHRGSFRYVQLVEEENAAGDTVVGSHSVGGGESLVVFDALDAVGLKPANYCDTSGAPSQEKVAFAARLIASQPHISGYFFSTCIANQPLSVTANGLVDGFRAAEWKGPTVCRIAGNQESEARQILEAWAEENDVPAVIIGREHDEWQAAAALAELLGREA
jgi:succinyl-CoA synthetase beta subunit